MNDKPVPWKGNLPVNRRYEKDIVRESDRANAQMQLITDIAKDAMDEVGKVHIYAALEGTQMAISTHIIKKGAQGILSESDNAFLSAQLNKGLKAIDIIATRAGEQTIEEMGKIPQLRRRSAMDDFFNDLFGR